MGKMKLKWIFMLYLVVSLSLFFISSQVFAQKHDAQRKGANKMTFTGFTLNSKAFKNGEVIPDKYAEKNIVSPPLTWTNIPTGTKSFAITVTDPDVPEAFQFPRVFAHWMIYNIPASETSLPEGASPGGKIPTAARELNSDFVTFKMPGYGKGYGGPWPPDAPHRYVFTIYALKAQNLNIPENADYTEFVKTILPQTIASTTLIGYYGPAKSPLPGN